MSDAEQPPQCETLGCENPSVEGGFCAECAEISPDVLTEDTTEGRHRASAESLSDDESSHDALRADNPAAETPSKAEADDRNPPNETSDTESAFVDAIGWFHDQLDRQIADHADEEGGHPSRSASAR